MPDPTPRTELRAVSACQAAAEMVCREINYSVAYSQGAPAAQPEEEIRQGFTYALSALTHQDWQGFASDCAGTVADHPGDFALYLVAGFCEYIIEEVKGVVELGATLVGFAGEYIECARDIGRPLTVFDLDLIINSDACVPFHDAALTMVQVQEFMVQLEAMGVEGIQEMATELFPVVMQIFEVVLEEGLVLLGDQRGAVEAWMRETAQDAVALGRMVGTIVGTVLLELGTAGIARALKTARIVSKLPGVPTARGLPDGDGALAFDTPLDLPFGATAGAPLASAEAAARSLAPMARGGAVHQLDELGRIFFLVLRRNRKRFSKNLSLAKLRVLRKHVKAEQFAKFAARRAALARGLAAGFRKHKGVIRRYADSKAEVQNFNRRVLTFHYSEAALDEDLDYFGVLARKDSILPNIFESNHIFEERMFHARRGAWSAEMRKLGWSSPADMEAVLMSADEHTGSVRRMLLRYGLPPHEVDGFEPPRSITRVLLDKIRLREDLDQTPGPDVLIVEPDTPFIEVLTKYAELYRANSPELWNLSLRNQFNAWRRALGLSEPVYR